MNKEKRQNHEAVKQAKPWFSRMTHEGYRKGAADYVTNISVAVQNYLKEALKKNSTLQSGWCQKRKKTWTDSVLLWILGSHWRNTNLIRDYHLGTVSHWDFMKTGNHFQVVNPLQELFILKEKGAYLDGTSYPKPPTGEFKMCGVFGSSPLWKTGTRTCSRWPHNVL